MTASHLEEGSGASSRNFVNINYISGSVNIVLV